MKKRFIFEIDITEEDRLFIADNKGLSIEQVTDEIITSCFQADLIDFYGPDENIVLKLDTRPPIE